VASFGEKKFMFLIAGGGLKRVVFGDTSCWVFYLLFFAIGVLDWNANSNAVMDQFNHI